MPSKTNNNIRVTFNPRTNQLKLSAGKHKEIFYVTEPNRQLFPHEKTEIKLTQHMFKQTLFRFLKKHHAFGTLLLNIHNGTLRSISDPKRPINQINQIIKPDYLHIYWLLFASGLTDKRNFATLAFYAYMLSTTHTP